MAHSSPSTHRSSTRHPDPDCPLWLHPTGRWTVKRKRRQFYFGKDAKAARKLWETGKQWYEAGQLPPERQDVPRVRDLLNAFLTDREQTLEAGDLVRKTFIDYMAVSTSMSDHFGRHTPIDEAFTLERLKAYRNHVAKRLVSPTSLGAHLGKVRTILLWGFEHRIVNTPIATGDTLKPPRLRRVREYKRGQGHRFLEPVEIRKVLEVAGPVWKAATLLGVNCGFGNTDIARLRVRDIDLEGGWIEYPRPKTGVMRRCPLWPETAEAVREALKARPKLTKPENRELVFLTPCGHPLVRVTENGAVVDAVPENFDRILRKAGVKRPGVSFYALRHSFRSAATRVRDREAADLIMGHSRGDMAETYIEFFPDERLVEVSDGVRAWVFGDAPATISIGGSVESGAG